MMMKKFLDCINSNKNLIRTGWMQRGVPPSIAESVAEHSYEAALIGFFLAEKLKKENTRIKPEKVALLLLLHDYTECIVGDIPYYTLIEMGRSQKEKIEARAMTEIITEDSMLKKYFNEWMRKKSLEAKIAKISDKLATLVEAKRLIDNGYAHVRDIYDNIRKEILTMLVDRKYSFAKRVVEEFISTIEK